MSDLEADTGGLQAMLAQTVGPTIKGAGPGGGQRERAAGRPDACVQHSIKIRKNDRQQERKTEENPFQLSPVW